MADVKLRMVRRRKARHEGYAFLSLLGLEEADPLALVRKVGRGFAFQSLVRFQENTDFSTADVADLVSIPQRTLQRRKAEGRLEPEESDRLLRVARVFAKALDLFEGDRPAAQNWLRTPAIALGGERPIRLARTDVGSREVEALIDRIEHGVLT
jgi:putative toxin-antitoxin system antitoxin component (TIGR02293 family)